LWRRMFLQEGGHLEVESSIVTPEIVLKASGHVEEFTDPVVECMQCHSKIRADHLVESKMEFKWDGKLETITAKVRDNDIKCPSCGGKVSDAFFSNLMFRTGIGADQETAYLRPETAQGIFTSFPRVFRNHGAKLPLAVGQIGKSFRNEISPRRGLVRMREFTQMELEYFFNPKMPTIEGFGKVRKEKVRLLTREAQAEGGAPQWVSAEGMVEKGIANEIMAYYLVKEWEYYTVAGLNPEGMWFRHLREEETPHYSQSNVDLEVETSHGMVEIAGNAYRTDYDLGRHGEYSKKEISVFSEETKEKVVPHVVEVSMGVDRLFFCMLEHSFREKSEGKDWEWFDFSPSVAPYDLCVFPLMKKDGLKEKAEGIVALMRENGLEALFSGSGSIGRRYAKADEIGVPYAVTIDYQTLEDESVTVRYRNDGKQERVAVEKLADKIRKLKREGKLKLD
ncbi:MAG TPA: glycine--tRNA ligase, partial [Candidatus Bilamarchaeaceae archaeon]|nr:glycine--tRNA ligase [Candidatus Bilamarchaeaceae archaeon]